MIFCVTARNFAVTASPQAIEIYEGALMNGGPGGSDTFQIDQRSKCYRKYISLIEVITEKRALLPRLFWPLQ